MDENEKLVSNLVAKLNYLSKAIPDIWFALKQKGIDVSDKDIALIGDKIRSISGGGSGVDIYQPFCYTLENEWDITYNFTSEANVIALYEVMGDTVKNKPIIEINLEGE